MSIAKQWMTLNQEALEKNLRLSNIALNGMERLVGLQIDVARGLLAENASTLKALGDAKTPQEVMALQQQLAQPAVSKALSIAKSVYETANTVQSELGQLVEEQVGEFNRQVSQSLDNMSKQAPTGADTMIRATQNAMDTAYSAYNNLSKTARQVSGDFAQAGLTAAENLEHHREAASSAKAK